MNINVTATKVTIDKGTIVNKGEYNIRDCNFTLSEEYNGLVCKALFTIEKTNTTYEQSIVNNKCTIPYEVTVEKGAITLGVIGYEIEDDELIKRYSPLPYHFTIEDGSYIEDIENQSTPTPSELEQLEQRVSQVEIDAEQVEINTQDISDIKQEQTTQNNDILLRSLITETGSQIELTLNSTNFKMTATLKDKNGNVVNTSNEIDLPLESVVVNASYDSSTKEIVLTLQNGNTVRFSVADLVSGLQTEITSSNKLSSDLVDDSTSTNKFVTASDKSNWNAKVSDTDYATDSKGGVIKTDWGTGTYMSNGKIQARVADYATYNSLGNSTFIGKGTLENVITGKQLVNETQLNTKADKSSLVTGTGENITLQNTAELDFIQPPLPMGNSEQVQYSGKNKLNNTSLTEQKTTNGITATPNADGSVTLNGTATATTFFILTNTQNFGDTDFSSANNASDSYKATLENSTGYVSLNYTHGNTTTAIRISNGITINNVTVYPMILLKTETDTSYEPYVGGTASPNPSYPQAISNVTGDVEVLVQNKNWFDYENATIRNNAYINYNTGAIAGSSTTNYAIENYIEIEASTIYTLANATSGMRLAFYDENETYISGKNNTFIGFTTPSNAKYIRFSDVDLSTVMLIKGNSTDTTYTPHQEQTFTFPLGTQRMYLGDYLADDGIHHVRKQKVFDGSSGEYWTLGNVIENTTGLYITDETVAFNTENKIIVLSDNFKENTPSQIIDNAVVGICSRRGTGRGIYVRVPNSIATTVADFKTWLSTHNTTVEYELATEEITPYTTEQQQAYDEIKQAISYEEQTNISGTSDESNPLFSVEAVKYKEPDYWTIAYVKTMIDKALQELS